MDKSITSIAFVAICLLSAAGWSIAQKGGARNGRAVLIKGGTFEMGIDEGEIPALMKTLSIDRTELFREASPKHEVTLSSFYLDSTEVTNAEYKKCGDKHSQWQKANISPEFHNGKYLQHWEGNDYPNGDGDHPVTFVSWHAAIAYCRSVNMRLSTEAEWEFAARGGLRNELFPWGSEMPETSRSKLWEKRFWESYCCWKLSSKWIRTFRHGRQLMGVSCR